MTIDSDDSYAISLRGGAACPTVDSVSTGDVERLVIRAERSYKAVETVSSDAQINQRNVTFSAGQSVVLGVGFEVGSQSILSIEINDSCSID
jgi:hypothetical protein